jgi:hypothetical protein
MTTPAEGQHSPGGSKPARQSKYGFRFLKHERAVLEKWYQENEGRTAPITIRKDWVMHWNNQRKHSQHLCCEVSHQQVKQWFENMRRTRNHKSRPPGSGRSILGASSPGSRRSQAGGGASAASGGVGGMAPNPSEQGMINPRLYLAASTGKMHTAINKSSQIISQHIDQLQQITRSPLTPLSPDTGSPQIEQGGDHFRWDAIDLQLIVEKLLHVLDNQIHSQNPSLPSPTTTVTPQQEFHFRVFKQLLEIDRQVEPEWKALKEISAALEANPTHLETIQQAAELVDLYLLKQEHVLTEKTKVMINLISHLNVLPNPTQPPSGTGGGKADKVKGEAASSSGNQTNDEANAAWTTAWTIPPGLLKRKSLDSKLCVFEGCFLNDEQRANFFLGVPVHASALASAVCFSLESGDSERLTSQEAHNLVSLYEVAAVQELELSEQLDKLWNLRPLQEDISAVNSWRSWLQDHHNPDIYYPLKVLADAVPAADQQYGFISVTRNSLVLSLGFLKGLRYALPLPLFTKCMINFTQAHYLFAAAAMLEELSLMFPQDNRDATPTPPTPPTPTPPSALKEERQNLEKEPVVGINPQPKEKAVMPEPVQAKDEEEQTLPEAKQDTAPAPAPAAVTHKETTTAGASATQDKKEKED